MADPFDLIRTTSENNPTEFMSSFHDLIGQKVMDALDQRKQAVAMSMFSDQEQEIDTDEQDDTNLQSAEEDSAED